MKNNNDEKKLSFKNLFKKTKNSKKSKCCELKIEEIKKDKSEQYNQDNSK